MDTTRGARRGAAALVLGLGLTVAASPAVAGADDTDPSSTNSRSPQSGARAGASADDRETPAVSTGESRAARRSSTSRTIPAPAAAVGSRAHTGTTGATSRPVFPTAATPAAPTAPPALPAVSPSSAPPVSAAVAEPVAAQVIRAAVSAIRAVSPAAAVLPAGSQPAPAAASPSAFMTATRLNSSPGPMGAVAGARLNPFDVVTAALALVSREVDRLLNRRPTANGTTTTLIATTVSPAATQGNTASYSVVNDWGTGHTANMTLTAGTTKLSNWTVEFDTPATITNIWNGRIASHTGTHYVISNVVYNGAVAAGKSTTFGYQATPGATGSAPTNIKVNGVPVGTATPPTAPTVSIADIAVAEGNSGTANATFTVSLSKAGTAPVTVGYATANGTATAGTDYTAANGTLTFAPGVTTQTIAVKVIGDTAVEPAEAFTVTLANPTGATLVRTSATATITNDDVAPPSQTSNAVTYSVVNDWGTGHTANMTLTAGTTKLSNWTVEFDTPATITNIWNGRIASHTGTHYVISNVVYNGAVAAGKSTTFGYQATPGATGSAPTNIKVNGVAVGTATPPTAPRVSIADLSVTEGNGEHAHFVFAVTMDTTSTAPVTVRYATSDGTAVAGSDYTATTGTLTFAPGVTTGTVHVDIIGDTAVEPNETFTVALSNPTGAAIARALATGTLVNDDTATSPVTTPGLSISDASATEPGSGGIAPGYLHTSGNQIVDSQGTPIQLSSVNWFGAESTTYAPHGLWTRGYTDMIDQMAAEGFNTIRLPYSSEMLHTAAKPNGIDFAKNPDLQGLSPIQVMDTVIAYAGQKGMRVVLDHHRSTAGAGTSENGLWYNGQYSEDQWVSDWQMLAARYKDNPTVIGFDLHNEPYNGTWGGGGANDWARAAERAGNAVLAVNPNLLIFTEGVGTYQGQSYWWGGNLMGVKDRPITLSVPNRVVYSPHDYPNSVWAQPWFQTANFGADLPNVFKRAWGYIYQDNIAPIWVGEFGTKLQDPKDVVWFEAITSYLSGDFDNNGTIDIPVGTEDMSWAFWAWNPNSGDTGGILADDWRTVNENKMAYLTPIEYTGGSGTSLASFTVTLASPSTQAVTVGYATSNGTATAAGDYTPASGTLTFAPGETRKTITVVIKGDSLTEGSEDFHVMLSNPSGATLADAMGMGTIVDRTTGTTTSGSTPTGTTSGGTTSGGTETPMPPTPSGTGYTDIMSFGMFHGSSHTGTDALAGGRTAITTEALVAYNGLRGFAGLKPATIEDVGTWAFANSLTNNAQAWGKDVQGVGLYYAMQGAKVGWIADDKYSPQIVADIERTARLGSAADVMTMVATYGHAGFAQYLTDNGLQTAFVDTLKMEPHYAGWMHDRANGRLVIDGATTAHDLNHLTVLSHDQMKPFMNDTWDWPQWPALTVPNARVIEYFQSMVTLGDPRGANLTALNRPRAAAVV